MYHVFSVFISNMRPSPLDICPRLRLGQISRGEGLKRSKHHVLWDQGIKKCKVLGSRNQDTNFRIKNFDPGRKWKYRLYASDTPLHIADTHLEAMVYILHVSNIS